jgi:1,4-alpha-glucan branching enzyme
MVKDGGGEWHASVDLPDGTHRYRFRLPSLSPFMNGATVDITDPRSRIVDEWDGDASVVIIEGGRDVTTVPDFAWQHDDVQLPQDHELIIYELHVAEFGWKDGEPGKFTDVADRLDYLRELGINAIELMPLAVFPGDKSWGYNVRHPFAIESTYGGPGDLKRLVDESHGRGIRVIMDLVLNHTESESPLTKIDFYYWFRDPYEGERSWGPKFDYLQYDDVYKLMPARKIGHEIAAYWISEYHLDGYRLDATDVLDNFDFVREVRNIADERSGGKPVFIVAEQLPEDPAIARPDGPADGAWHQRFEFAVVDALCEADGGTASRLVNALQPATAGYSVPELVVNYVESHDEQTLMFRLAEHGIFGDEAFNKHKLAASLLFTAVGIPMLYQGQEFGGHRIRDLEIRPLEWNLLDEDYGLHLKEHYEALARIRHGSPALKGRELEVLHVDDAAKLIAYRRGFGEAEMIVVANLRDTDTSFTIPFPNGRWHELVFEYEIEATNGNISDTLPPSTAKLYVRDIN